MCNLLLNMVSGNNNLKQLTILERISSFFLLICVSYTISVKFARNLHGLHGLNRKHSFTLQGEIFIDLRKLEHKSTLKGRDSSLK